MLSVLEMKLPGLRTLPLAVLGVLGLVGLLSASAGGRWLLTRILEPRLSAWSRGARWTWGLGALAVAGLLLVMVPVRMSHPLWVGGAVVGLGPLVLAAGLWATSLPARVPSGTPPGRWSWAAYVPPCLLCWCPGWLAFWPAVMTHDSVDQWEQMTTGHYADVHPVFHTFSNGLITHVWRSPAAVVGFQMLALACSAGWCLATLRRYGLSRAWSWGLCLLFALSPVNGWMVITLWKDIPYSIVLLLLGGVVFHIVFSEGAWLRERFSATGLGLLSGLAMLYRYNGFAACVGTGAALLLAYPRLWRRTLGATLLGLALWGGTQAALNAGLDVEHHPWARLQPLVDQIAAHVAAGTELTPEERSFAARLHPLEGGWDYTCYDHQRYYFDGRFHTEVVDAHPDEVLRVWWALLRRDPGVNLRHMACSGALVWRLSTGDSYLLTTGIWGDPEGELHSLEPNAQGLERRAVWPALIRPLVRVLHWTERRGRIEVLWRPAFFLLVLLAAVAVTALRARSGRFLLLAAPVGFHSALLLFVTPNQDFRFQYGVYLTALLFGVPLLFGRLPCAPPAAAGASAAPTASA